MNDMVNDAAPELVEGEGVQMMVPGEFIEATTVEGSSSASALVSGVKMQGLQVYNPGVLTTTTTTSQSMTYSAPQADSVPQTDSVPQIDSAPQTDSAPQAPMNDMVMTGSVESQSMASQSITYEAPQAPVPSESVAVPDKVVVYPPMTVTAEEFAKLNGSILTEPLPVTDGAEAIGIEALGVGTKREVDVNNAEALDETVKVKKQKSKRCC